MLIITPERTAALVYENIVDFSVKSIDDKTYTLNISTVIDDSWAFLVVGTEEYVRAAFEKVIMGAERNLRVVYL